MRFSGKRAAEITEAVFKATQSSGGAVDEHELQAFRASAMTATSGMSDRMMFGGLAPLIGQMGGAAAGIGLQTAYNQLNGSVSPAPQPLVQEANRLGLWDRSKIKLIKDGAANFPHGNPLDAHLRDLMSKDLPAFAAEMLRRYQKAGITSPNEIARENSMLFGTGSEFFNSLMRQLPVVQQSLKSYDQVHGLSQTVNDNKSSPQIQMLQLHKSLEDLGLEIGQAVLPLLRPLVKTFSDLFQVLGRHPTLIGTLTIGFIGLGAVMTFGGTLMMLSAGFGALRFAMSMFSVVIPALVTGIGGAGVVGSLGGVLAGLASPVGIAVLAIGAIAAAIGAIGALWHRSHAHQDESRPVNTVSPPLKCQTLMVYTTINLDGRKIAQAMTPYMSEPLGLGLNTGGIDPILGRPMLGLKD